MPQIKTGPISFSVPDNFKGDVEIVKGEVRLKVPMESLIRVVAEKVRFDRMAVLVDAKPNDLISKLA
jgi:hypothetical protein